MRVLIAGAGIGGLTTALALERRGIDARVFESARAPPSSATPTATVSGSGACHRLGADRLRTGCHPEAFADWRSHWLDCPALIRSAEAVFEFPIVDRDPLPRWTHGRATLLGDAAHPM